jgi:predicted enzyme related to lactoylglutathione lyase
MTLAVSPALEGPPLTLGRVVVLVRDYDVALAFYRAAFGARVLFDAPSPAGGRYLHLGFGDTAGSGMWLLQAGGEAAARVGRQTGGEPLAVFYTVDVPAAVARAAAAGAKVVRSVESADGATFAHVADLYGNVFVLVHLPPAVT